MQMDTEARTLVAQLVKALAPLNYPAMSSDQQGRSDGERVTPGTAPTLGQVRAATAAIVAGNAALAATAA